MPSEELPLFKGDTEKSDPLRYLLAIMAVALITFAGYMVFATFVGQVIPSLERYSLYLLAIVAGVASFFSPCSFPLLPGYLSFYYSAKHDRQKNSALRYGMFAAAGVVTFTLLLGAVVALLGQGFAISLAISTPNPSLVTRLLRVGIGGILVVLGALQLAGVTFHSQLLNAVTQRFAPSSRDGRTSLYLYGFGYNAAGIGCAGPILAGLIVFALGSGGFLYALLAFTLYAGTMAILMLGVSMIIASSKNVLIERLKASTPKIKKATSLVLVVVGVLLIYLTLNLQFFVQSLFPK